MQVTPGQRIAQLLLIPYIQQGKAINRKRGTQNLEAQISIKYMKLVKPILFPRIFGGA